MFNPNTEVQAFRINLKREKGNKIQVAPAMNILAWQEEGICFAHCLELDIVAEGKTMPETFKALSELIISQIEFAETNRMEIFHPAPSEYWQKLFEIHSNKVKQHLLDNPPKSSRELLKGLDAVHA